MTARPGRRPGRSSTREAILAAARRSFAELGYDRASIRAIADEAGVDGRLVMHSFGSKQRLFVAAADLPVDPAEVLPALRASLMAAQVAGLILTRAILRLEPVASLGRDHLAAALEPVVRRYFVEPLD